MIVGCYTMDLYCDGLHASWHFEVQIGTGTYTGRTAEGCKRQARKDGWRFHRDRLRAFCPECAKYGIRKNVNSVVNS